MSSDDDDGFSSDGGGSDEMIDKGGRPLTEVVELLQKAMADGAVETALKAVEGFETLESCTFAEDGAPAIDDDEVRCTFVLKGIRCVYTFWRACVCMLKLLGA